MIMKKVKYIILLLGIVLSTGLKAQVNIVEESDISRMMNAYMSHARSSEFMDGWKIQLATTTDRRKMEAARSKFAGQYPGINTYWKHVAPYYQVQIGAYRTKLELQGFLIQLKDDFPNAIPVMARIRKTELLR